jgi:hypothetical protein
MRVDMACKAMEKIPGRFALTVGHAKEDSSPCLSYREVAGSELVSNLISMIINFNFEPITLTNELNERVALAFGALVNTFKPSEQFLKPGSAISRKRKSVHPN